MGSPTGAFKVVYDQGWPWKWTKTTVIVALYLITNVAGRLSVAIFGLTFSLNDESGINYAVRVTDWNSSKGGDSLGGIIPPGNSRGGGLPDYEGYDVCK